MLAVVMLPRVFLRCAEPTNNRVQPIVSQPSLPPAVEAVEVDVTPRMSVADFWEVDPDREEPLAEPQDVVPPTRPMLPTPPPEQSQMLGPTQSPAEVYGPSPAHGMGYLQQQVTRQQTQHPFRPLEQMVDMGGEMLFHNVVSNRLQMFNDEVTRQERKLEQLYRRQMMLEAATMMGTGGGGMGWGVASQARSHQLSTAFGNQTDFVGRGGSAGLLMDGGEMMMSRGYLYDPGSSMPAETLGMVFLCRDVLLILEHLFVTHRFPIKWGFCFTTNGSGWPYGF